MCATYVSSIMSVVEVVVRTFHFGLGSPTLLILFLSSLLGLRHPSTPSLLTMSSESVCPPVAPTGISYLILVWSNSLLASLNSRRSLRDTFNRKNSGSMSATFRVGSPMISTIDAERGQISVVQVSNNSYMACCNLLIIFRRFLGKAKAKAPMKKAVGPRLVYGAHIMPEGSLMSLNRKIVRRQADSRLKFGLAWLMPNKQNNSHTYLGGLKARQEICRFVMMNPKCGARQRI